MVLRRYWWFLDVARGEMQLTLLWKGTAVWDLRAYISGLYESQRLAPSSKVFRSVQLN